MRPIFNQTQDDDRQDRPIENDDSRVDRGKAQLPVGPTAGEFVDYGKAQKAEGHDQHDQRRAAKKTDPGRSQHGGEGCDTHQRP